MFGDPAGQPCLILESKQKSVSQGGGDGDCREVTERGSDTSCVPSEIEDAQSCPSVGIQGGHWALAVLHLPASLLLCIPAGGWRDSWRSSRPWCRQGERPGSPCSAVVEDGLGVTQKCTGRVLECCLLRGWSSAVILNPPQRCWQSQRVPCLVSRGPRSCLLVRSM